MKLPLQNKLINGAFDYWQRGSSFPGAVNIYTADRWKYEEEASSTMVLSVSRSTDLPPGSNSLYSLQLAVTTAQASIGASQYSDLVQSIEGNVLRGFKGKKFLLSFWVKSNKVGTYCSTFRNGSYNKTLVKEFTVNSANTWEKKIIRATHDLTGTWSYDTSAGLRVVFCLAAGANYRKTKDSWLSEDGLCSTSQVNFADTIGNTFQIADVCLVEDNEEQTRNPDFVYAGRDVFEELQLCQRYYNINEPPGWTFDNTSYSAAQVGNTRPMGRGFRFPVIMRIIPSVALTTSSHGFNIAPITTALNAEFFSIYVATGIALSANPFIYDPKVTADAEL